MPKVNRVFIRTISHRNYKKNVNFRIIKRKKTKSNSSTFHLITHFIAFLLCGWQVFNCFHRYSTTPITVNVDMNENFHNYTYPTVVVCPFGYHLLDYVTTKMRAYCHENNASCSDWKTHHFGSKNVTDFWINDVMQNCHSIVRCENAISQGCKETISNGKYVDIVQGRCVAFSNDNVYSFISTKYSQFHVEFTNVTKPLKFAAQILFSTRNIFKYNQEFTSLLGEYANGVYFSPTLFYNVNSYVNPCWDEENVINCMNSCMDRLLAKSEINCRMPFYENMYLPVCSSYAEISQLKKALEYAYKNKNKCLCKKSCYTTMYSPKVVAYHFNKKTLYFHISIPKTIVAEIPAYPLSSLMAEVFSLVGFFLGLSMISALNHMPYGVKKLIVIVKRMNHIFT